MSTDFYAVVLTDLRAKHAALGELIAALENVSRLGSSGLAVVERPVPPREKRQRPQRATPDAPEAPPERRNGDRDEALVRLVGKHPGLGTTDVARKFGPKDQDVNGLAARLSHNLKRLVTEGRLARHGFGYYPAGTPAPKEAP